MTKQELRKEYLQKRQSLTDEEYEQRNHIIAHSFFSLDLSKVKTIHTFLPIFKRREPDTWLIINKIQEEYSEKKIVVSKVNENSRQLDHFYFTSKDQLQVNVWGIPEPVEGIPASPKDIELVITPLLCFDIKGNRVGYGKGFYDKFFEQCSAECKKVGLSLFAPVKSIDVEPHDIKLDVCITPEQLYLF